MRKEMRLQNKNMLKGEIIIALYGTTAQIQTAEDALSDVELTGHEAKDRLVIQKLIDRCKLKADILYNGNTVYGYEKLAKELQKMKKSGSIEKMSKEMYKFLSLNFDIAYYNQACYIDHYDGRFSNMLFALDLNVPAWKSDVNRLAQILRDAKCGA